MYFFIQNFIFFWQNKPVKVQIFRLATACMKINQIPYVIFQTTSQFSLNIESPFIVMTPNFSVIF